MAAKAGERHTEIEFFRRQHGRFIIKFRGLDDITEAEKWIGAEIKIPANELLPPKEGWFYKFQLKGCRVFSDSGEYLGDATDMIDSAGAQILKVIHGENGDRGDVELLIPFAEPYIKKIDLDQQRIEVSLPQDLRELNK